MESTVIVICPSAQFTIFIIFLFTSPSVQYGAVSVSRIRYAISPSIHDSVANTSESI